MIGTFRIKYVIDAGWNQKNVYVFVSHSSLIDDNKVAVFNPKTLRPIVCYLFASSRVREQ